MAHRFLSSSWTFSGLSAVFCAFGLVAFGSWLHAEAIDIRADGPFCKTQGSRQEPPDDLITPTWASKPAPMTKDPRVTEIDQVAHELNSTYLRNMISALYVRLAAARSVGLALAPYSEGLKKVAEYCGRPDRSGQIFSEIAKDLMRVPDQVNADFADFKLDPAAPELYMRRLVVAALESHRVRTLLAAFENQTPPDPTKAKQQQLVAQAYLRRLLRLQHHYPTLVLSGVLGGGDDFEASVGALMNVNSGWGLLPMLQSDPQVELNLGLSPVGAPPAQLPAPPWVSDSEALQAAEKAHQELYASILQGRRPLPAKLVQRIRKALDMSVRETLSSAHLKCQNTSPCAALSIDPNLAATFISASANADALRRQACHCKIGAQHEWVDGRLNVALGIVTAGAIVGASLTPAGWFTYLAYGLATVDSLAAGAGINDSYINVRRSDGVALLRSGGAVDPIVEIDTLTDYQSQTWNAAYNMVTGIIGIVPPGRILGRSAEITALQKLQTHQTIARAKMEFSKAATGAPAPDMAGEAYESSYDPRETSAPVPFELRLMYPRLAATMDRAYAHLNPLDADTKRKVFEGIKAVAREMARSQDPAALEALQKGVIPNDKLPKVARQSIGNDKI